MDIRRILRYSSSISSQSQINDICQTKRMKETVILLNVFKEVQYTSHNVSLIALHTFIVYVSHPTTSMSSALPVARIYDHISSSNLYGNSHSMSLDSWASSYDSNFSALASQDLPMSAFSGLFLPLMHSNTSRAFKREEYPTLFCLLGRDGDFAHSTTGPSMLETSNQSHSWA